MKSIDLIAPQEPSDNSQQITPTNNTELVNSLVGAVKELVDVQTDTTNQLVEKMTNIISQEPTTQEPTTQEPTQEPTTQEPTTQEPSK